MGKKQQIRQAKAAAASKRQGKRIGAASAKKLPPRVPVHGPEQWHNAGLLWLDEVKKGVRVTLRPVPERPRFATAKDAERFGRALARTHLAGAPGFGAAPPGWSGDGYLGGTRMRLPEQHHLPSTWGEFYAIWQLMPAAQAALEAGTLDATSMGHIELLCELLASGAHDDRRPPARVHGDLWRGTVSYTKRGVLVSRPSAHGGHAETDMATLRLYGLPFLDHVEGAWAEVYRPLGDWQERSQLHQLHAILRNSMLFSNPRGRTYYDGRPPHMAGEIAESYVRRAR